MSTPDPVVEYYNYHNCCPICGTPCSTNEHVDVSETGYDGNRVRCGNKLCTGTKAEFGRPARPWEGIVHELVPTGRSQMDLAEVDKK